LIWVADELQEHLEKVSKMCTIVLSNRLILKIICSLHH
jgi:hypothetical protein